MKLVLQTESEESICSLPIEHPARHGDRVLIQFFKNLAPNGAEFTLSLYSLFTSEGITSQMKWEEALRSVQRSDVHLVASAVALKGNFKQEQLPPLFLASGQWGGKVKKDDIFFPQESLKESKKHRANTLLFGSYHLDTHHQEAYDDHTLLYKNLINYWFAASEHDILSGSSNALALGTARAMSFCAKEIIDFDTLKDCLKKREVHVTTVGKNKLRQF